MTWGPKYSWLKLIQGLCAVGCVPTYGTLIFWSESVLQFYWKCKKCAVSFCSFSTLIFKLYWFVFIFSFFLWKMLKLVSELPLNFILFKIVYDDNHNNRSFCTKETKIILFEVFFFQPIEKTCVSFSQTLLQVHCDHWLPFEMTFWVFVWNFTSIWRMKKSLILSF
jgi:hypothetical protein